MFRRLRDSLTKRTLIIPLAALFAACATHGHWRPTLDPRLSTDPSTIERDMDECQELALKVSGKAGKKALKGTALGAVAGAAIGTVLGAVSGDPGGGAAAGAAIGGVGGGVHGTVSAEERYKMAYTKCLRGRGHRVLN